MLPKIKIATFETTLPYSKKTITYRPYTVKEEKILLIAVQSSETKDMVTAVKQVVQNCIVNEDIDVSKIHIFDVEYMLMKLRAISTSDTIQMSFLDNEDGKNYEIEFSIEEILANSVKDIVIQDKKIQLSDEIGVVMNELTIYLFINGNLQALEDPNTMYAAFKNMIETIYDEDNVYPVVDASDEEFAEFIDSLTGEAAEKLSAYFKNMPKLKYTVSFVNSKGTKREKEIEGLSDFFV